MESGGSRLEKDSGQGEVGECETWISDEGVAFPTNFLRQGSQFWYPRRFGEGIYWRRGCILYAFYVEGVAFLTHFLTKGTHF